MDVGMRFSNWLILTPLIINQNASVTSNTNMGNHTSQVTDEAQDMEPPNNPTSCSGRITTSRAEAITPSCASAVGINCPRKRSHEKKRLPTEK